MAWDSNGFITDPSDNQIIADTGALGGLTTATFTMLISSDVACEIALEHRNATNTANIHSHRINHNDPSRTVDLQFPVTLGVNERLRLRLITGFEGALQGSILS